MPAKFSVFGVGGVRRDVKAFTVYGAGGVARKVTNAWVYGANGVPRKFFASVQFATATFNMTAGSGTYAGVASKGYRYFAFGDTNPSPINDSLGNLVYSVVTNPNGLHLTISTPSDLTRDYIRTCNFDIGGFGALPVASATYDFGITYSGQATWRWALSADYVADEDYTIIIT